MFVVVSAAEPDALREASFFVDRLSEEHMPLAGLILNRTHPTLCELHPEKATEAAEQLEAAEPGSLPAAVLRTTMSRSVSMPTSRSPSHTGKAPMFSASIRRAASHTLWCGETAATSRVITSHTRIRTSSLAR